MTLKELYNKSPSTASIFRKAGKDIITKIYGNKAKFKKMVSGRYTKQPWFELKYGQK